jgi:hypothetical protein
VPYNNVIGMDPQLTDPENGDYRPSPTSFAKDYGCQTFLERAEDAVDVAPPSEAPNRSVRFDVIDVSGRISADTVWNADTVRVVGDVTVMDGVKLTIEPGVRVEFQDFYSLKVAGTLLAMGTPHNRILFTTDEPESFVVDDSHTGSWNGIRFENTRATNDPSHLAYCTIEYSKATAVGGSGSYPYGGGAVSAVDFSKLTIENSILRNNVGEYGGAVFLYRNANPRIRNNLIVDNHALDNASAVYSAYSYPKIANNTMVRNTIQNEANPYFESCGVLNFLAKPEFTNNIVRDNDPVVVYQHSQLMGDKEYYTRNNNIEDYGNSGGNIDADPRFVDPDGPDDAPATPDDDFRLTGASPCIDTGLNDAVPPDGFHDVGGTARVVDGDDDGDPVVDMGAHEYPHGNVLSFEPDGVTITWLEFGGAQLYRVYRGDFFDLVDGDADGLPDSGYGECMNHLDPDASDTTFLDVEIPDPGAGFFYLMSVVDVLGEERFLGMTSAGQPRGVLSPCIP